MSFHSDGCATADRLFVKMAPKSVSGSFGGSELRKPFLLFGQTRACCQNTTNNKLEIVLSKVNRVDQGDLII